MKIVGLIFFLSLSVLTGIIYWNSNTFKAQSVPEAYKVLDDLEENGIYQRQDLEFHTLAGKKLNLSDFKVRTKSPKNSR